MRTIIFSVVAFLFLGMGVQVSAQRGIVDGSKYGHGDDSIRCVMNLSLYRDNVKQKLLKDAYRYWRIVYTECPTASKNLFIDGPKIMYEVIEKAATPELKQAYIDTLMMVYDARIKYFGQRGFVVGRKGVDLLKYRSDKLEAVDEAYTYLMESVATEKKEMTDQIIATAMNSAVLLHKSAKLNDDEFISSFAKINEAIDELIAKESKDLDHPKAKDAVIAMFVGEKIPCDKLDVYYSAKVSNLPNDTSLLKEIVNVCENMKCMNSKVYYVACESLLKTNASAKLYYLVATLARSRDENEKAINYFQKAIDIETDGKTKADYLMQLANLSTSNPSQARNYVRQAIELDASNTAKGYLVIGYIYSTVKNCNNGELNPAPWLAVDYYNKAKSIDASLAESVNQQISYMYGQYPSKEVIFFNGLEEGQSYTVGCWINETTTVRGRK